MMVPKGVPELFRLRSIETQKSQRHAPVVRGAVSRLALAVSLVSVGACSSDDGSASADSESWLVDFPRDRNHGVLPMDQFRLDLPQSLYALDLATYACVEDEGMEDQLAVPQPLSEQDNVFSGPGGRRLFNAELASQFGYHTGPPDASGPDPSFTSESTIHDTPEGEAIYQECRDQALEGVPEGIDLGILQNGITSHVASEISLRANAEVEEAPDIAAARERWQECMAPVGIADLPDDPVGMPTASMRDAYGLNADETGAATTDEIEVAVADAECQESSGYAETVYNLTWEAQVELAAEHEDELVRAKSAREALQEYIENTISNYGADAS